MLDKLRDFIVATNRNNEPNGSKIDMWAALRAVYEATDDPIGDKEMMALVTITKYERYRNAKK